jgi:hypothetical protein
VNKNLQAGAVAQVQLNGQLLASCLRADGSKQHQAAQVCIQVSWPVSGLVHALLPSRGALGAGEVIIPSIEPCTVLPVASPAGLQPGNCLLPRHACCWTRRAHCTS